MNESTRLDMTSRKSIGERKLEMKYQERTIICAKAILKRENAS